MSCNPPNNKHLQWASLDHQRLSPRCTVQCLLGIYWFEIGIYCHPDVSAWAEWCSNDWTYGTTLRLTVEDGCPIKIRNIASLSSSFEKVLHIPLVSWSEESFLQSELFHLTSEAAVMQTDAQGLLLNVWIRISRSRFFNQKWQKFPPKSCLKIF